MGYQRIDTPASVLSSTIDAATIVSRMGTRPNRARAAAAQTLVASLKADGTWDRLDALYLLAGASEQVARLNWVGCGQDLTAVNTPAFTTNSGYTGDGSTSYLDPGLASNACDKFSRNDASMWVWSLTNTAVSGPQEISGTNSYISCRNGSGQVAVRSNFSGTVGSPISIAVSASTGLFGWSRTASDLTTVYHNGASIGTSTLGTEALTSTAINLLRSSAATAYSSRKLAMAALGGGLTAAQAAGLYTAVSAYLTAVGAI